MRKICFVITAEFAVNAFMLNHLRALSKIYDVTLIVNTKNTNFLLEKGIHINVVHFDIAREVSWISDIHTLIMLIVFFYQQRFVSVHSVTPKAGLLAMSASWIVRVPLRVHTFTGQVWVTRFGIKRFLLKKLDRLISFFSTFNIVDSPSQRQFLVDENILTWSKSTLLAEGSISGVDLARFKPNWHKRLEVRLQLGIGEEDMFFLFVGRLTQDKGVLDLAHAFIGLPLGAAHLVFMGPDEGHMQAEIERITEHVKGYVHFVSYSDVPELYMAAADVLCLPSYREGFGTVVIEAAAVGIPAIASRIYGVSDAVVDGKTGLLHEPHDISAIQNCMERFINNHSLVLILGESARSRAVAKFDSKLITQEWVSFYHENIH